LHGTTGFLMPTWITSNGIRMDLFRGHNALLALLRDSALRARMSSASLQHIQNTYSFDNCARVLCDCVRRAIERAPRSDSVVAAPTHHATISKVSLPTVDPPWETYIPSVRHYVSQSCPALDTGCWIRLAAPLILEGHGIYRLLDPTWPATFDLTNNEFDLVSQLSQWQKSDSFLACSATQRKLQSWIEDGLLLCSTGHHHA